MEVSVIIGVLSFMGALGAGVVRLYTRISKLEEKNKIQDNDLINHQSKLEVFLMDFNRSKIVEAQQNKDIEFFKNSLLAIQTQQLELLKKMDDKLEIMQKRLDLLEKNEILHSICPNHPNYKKADNNEKI